MAVHGLHTLGLADSLLFVGHAGLTRQVLARFDLDSRTERFLLSHLTALKEMGKGYVGELLETSLRVLVQPTVAESYDSDVEAHIYDVLASALVDRSQRDIAMGGRTLEDITRRLLRKRKRAAEQTQIEAALDWLDQWVRIDSQPEEAFTALADLIGSDQNAHQTLQSWRTSINLLSAYDVKAEQIKIQPALARSWEYYTGIVFELRSSTDVHLGGGGRYDELARLIGSNTDVPAVGFAYYADEMLSILTHVIGLLLWLQKLR
jgi:histidyl-tRNA synthetase